MRFAVAVATGLSCIACIPPTPRVELPPAPARAVTAAPPQVITNVVYVVDGTGGKAEHQDVLWRIFARVIPSATDTSRYWEGVRDIPFATDADAILNRVTETICRDAQPRDAGGLGAQHAYLLGYSRGAIIAVRAASEVRSRCGVRVGFLGLVDPVNTSMRGWPTAVDSTEVRAIQVVKQDNRGAGPLATTPIAGAHTVAHPDAGITHQQLTCPVGHEKDADGNHATWTEHALVEALREASAHAGTQVSFADPLPPSCPPGWFKYLP